MFEEIIGQGLGILSLLVILYLFYKFVHWIVELIRGRWRRL